MRPQHYLVPQHDDGTSTDLEHTIAAGNLEDAEDLFVDAKDAMLDVNTWAKRLAPAVLVHLADAHGKPVNRSARRGDHLCLDSGSPDHDYEWVLIESLEYDDYPDDLKETFAIRLHAVAAPGHISPATFSEEASGTLVVERLGRNIHALYHWRDCGEDHQVRTGLWHSISNDQWLTIITGFIAANA